MKTVVFAAALLACAVYITSLSVNQNRDCIRFAGSMPMAGTCTR